MQTQVSSVVVWGQTCDVMAGDSLLTLCRPSASSADTNTSNLFQLRPGLLSRSRAAPPNMLVTGHQSSRLLRVQVRIHHSSRICTQARYFDYAHCGWRNAYSQKRDGSAIQPSLDELPATTSTRGGNGFPFSPLIYSLSELI